METAAQINHDLADMELGLARSMFTLLSTIEEAVEARADSIDEAVLAEMDAQMEIPTDPEKAFDLLWEVASEMVDDPAEYEDAITMFASYFAEMGGEHMAEVASSGIAAVDSEFVAEMLGAMEYDAKEDLEDAVANIIDFAQGVLAGDE